MNCAEIDKALIEGANRTTALGSDVGAHIAGCARCRALVNAMNEAVPAEWPSASVLHRIETAIAADLRPVRPLLPTHYGMALLAGISLCVLIVLFAGLHFGAFGIEAKSTLQMALILATLSLSFGLLVYSLVNQMAPGHRRRIRPGLVPLGIVAVLVVVVGVVFPFEKDEDFLANSWICLKAGTGIGLLAAVPFWLVIRRGGFYSPAQTGAALGLSAGLVGAVALEVHCPYLEAWHIVVSHVGAAAVCGLIGLAVGFAFQVLGRRSRPFELA